MKTTKRIAGSHVTLKLSQEDTVDLREALDRLLYLIEMSRPAVHAIDERDLDDQMSNGLPSVFDALSEARANSTGSTCRT